MAPFAGPPHLGSKACGRFVEGAIGFSWGTRRGGDMLLLPRDVTITCLACFFIGNSCLVAAERAHCKRDIHVFLKRGFAEVTFLATPVMSAPMKRGTA